MFVSKRERRRKREKYQDWYKIHRKKREKGTMSVLDGVRERQRHRLKEYYVCLRAQERERVSERKA